jgi:molybdopterin/thiamine biosynthesis adenylyltransferase
MIVIEGEDRYERLKVIKNLNMDKVRQAKVMVIGAGAVGNEVIKNLALYGVGHIFIYDIDHIEKSNLTRSVLFREKDTSRKNNKAVIAGKRAKELNPDCDISASKADVCYEVGLGLFRRMDAVICCVDSRLARLMINRFCYWFDKPWINAGILDAEGICTVYKPSVNDYESELSPAAWKNISVRFGCPDVARHMLKEGSIPTTPITASIIGAMQVSEAMKIIHGYDEQLLAGLEFRFDLRINEFLLIDSKHIDEMSESNKRIQHIHETSLSCNSSLNDLRKEIEKHTEDQDYEIMLRDPIVTEVVRESDNKHFKMFVKESSLAEYIDKHDLRDINFLHLRNRLFITKKVNAINRDSPISKNKKLKQLGIPDLDVIEVRTHANGTMYFELSGDLIKYRM